MQNLDIRRHADGTIDFDFYRRRAALVRREARWRALKRWPAFFRRIVRKRQERVSLQSVTLRCPAQPGLEG